MANPSELLARYDPVYADFLCRNLCLEADSLCQRVRPDADKAYKSGQYKRAIELCVSAELLNPQSALPWASAGTAMLALDDLDGAQWAAENGLNRDPCDHVSIKNLYMAELRQNLGHHSRAAQYAMQALRLTKPSDRRCLFLYGVVVLGLLAQLNLREAEGIFSATLQSGTLEPGCYRFVREAYAITQLFKRRFPEWFATHGNAGVGSTPGPIVELAEFMIGVVASFVCYQFNGTARSWDGAALDGRRLLIRCHGTGLGDALNYIRYTSSEAFNGRVIVQCRSRIAPLLQRIPSIHQVVTTMQFDEFDVDTGVTCLPFLCHATPETILANIPYLTVEPERVEKWRVRIGRSGYVKVGIVWQCGAGKTDQWRNVPSDALFSLRDIPGIRLYSLQRSPDGIEAEPIPDDIVSIEKESDGTLLDSAAAILNMDLIVSVDSMICHLAGGMGVPTWTLLPTKPVDWRWMAARTDTPWYPTMRLFRQISPSEWHSVMDQVRTALTALVKLKGTI